MYAVCKCNQCKIVKKRAMYNIACKLHIYDFATTQCILQAACRGEINECYNGGTMIWDLAKTFSCICMEGYKGELCKTERNNVI